MEVRVEWLSREISGEHLPSHALVQKKEFLRHIDGTSEAGQANKDIDNAHAKVNIQAMQIILRIILNLKKT